MNFEACAPWQCSAWPSKIPIFVFYHINHKTEIFWWFRMRIFFIFDAWNIRLMLYFRRAWRTLVATQPLRSAVASLFDRALTDVTPMVHAQLITALLFQITLYWIRSTQGKQSAPLLEKFLLQHYQMLKLYSKEPFICPPNLKIHLGIRAMRALLFLCCLP